MVVQHHSGLHFFIREQLSLTFFWTVCVKIQVEMNFLLMIEAFKQVNIL